jgi:Phosphotransferase enzyme family
MLVRSVSDISESWLSDVLGETVIKVRVNSGQSNWAQQLTLDADLHNGTTRTLRLKICLGETFGPSEVEYYTRDYVDLVDAPLVRCFDAKYEPLVGYHILLEDLAATHRDRRDAPPTLAYGKAVAEALGRMHRHHWQSREVPGSDAIDRYLDTIRAGLAPIERVTAIALRDRFERHEQAFRLRWSNPQGMSLLHGDLNPTNVLTPRDAEYPVYFLDRQPFDWSLTYGVAVSDLAYFMILWWPEETRRACEVSMLRHWYDALGKPDYTWADAQADWKLSVEQCLNVPMEWCVDTKTLVDMRWLWETQFSRVQAALVSYKEDET